MTQFTSTGKPSVGLVQFPGSNCDMDCLDTMRRHFGIETKLIWHTEASLPKLDAVVLPGGFSYGDYLRSGALASHSPVMASVKEFVRKGGPVIGICNGFQILTESHLLPGALLRNSSRQFICKYVSLAGQTGKSVYSSMLAGRTLRMPIAHGEGRYYIDQEGLKKLNDQGQVVFRYADQTGAVTDAANPNGSLGNIAGIVSGNGRVFGLMPHPERATDTVMGGSDDGLLVWRAFFASFL